MSYGWIITNNTYPNGYSKPKIVKRGGWWIAFIPVPPASKPNTNFVSYYFRRFEVALKFALKGPDEWWADSFSMKHGNFGNIYRIR